MSPSTKRILSRQWIGYWVKQMVDYEGPASCSFSVRDSATVSTILSRSKKLNDCPLFGAKERTLLLVAEQHVDRFDGFRRTQYRLDYRPDQHRRKVIDELSPEKTVYYFETYQAIDFSFLGRVKNASLRSNLLVIVEAKSDDLA